uniref:Putative ovule protein n=1 Tax=Solanum chacoense TaxID=4108 RepID=A0A0V0GZ76_SOLCH
MDGSGVHTFTLINRAGKSTYVKFHWKPTCGVTRTLARRWVETLSDPCITYEIRSIWISYWSQAEKSLGQKLASRLNVKTKHIKSKLLNGFRGGDDLNARVSITHSSHIARCIMRWTIILR